MKIKITEIGPESTYYEDRKALIGMTGTLTMVNLPESNGFSGISMTADAKTVKRLSLYWKLPWNDGHKPRDSFYVFYQVKYEEVKSK